MDIYKSALAKATGRADSDADVVGEPMMLAVAHASRVASLLIEIERLRAALKPFAEIGGRLHAANQQSDQSVLIGASARFLKLDPLTGQDFVNAHNAVEQVGSDPSRS